MIESTVEGNCAVQPVNDRRSTTGTFAVIPAHNEGATVGSVVRAVRTHLPDCHVVVVDDGSSDNTSEEAARAGAKVISLPFNCGYGVALQTGLLYAARNAACYTVTIDADGQHEAADAPRLLKPLQENQADVTLGSRYLLDSRSYKIPVSRRYPSRLLSRVLSSLIGQQIYDTTTGFQGLNRKSLQTYLTMNDFPEKTPDADLLLYAHLQGCRLMEVPVSMYPDTTGDSMHGLWKSMFYLPKMAVSLLSILLSYRRWRT